MAKVTIVFEDVDDHVDTTMLFDPSIDLSNKKYFSRLTMAQKSAFAVMKLIEEEFDDVYGLEIDGEKVQ